MALKERDIEERLKSMGFERGVKYCLLEMTGEIRQLEKALIQNAQVIDQMTDIIQQFTQVAENMKNQAETLQRRLGPEDPSLMRPSDDRNI